MPNRLLLTIAMTCAGLAFVALPVGASAPASGGGSSLHPRPGFATTGGSGNCTMHFSGVWTVDSPIGPTFWGLSASAYCAAPAAVSTTIGLLRNLLPETNCPTGHNNPNGAGGIANSARSKCNFVSPVGPSVWTEIQQTYVTQRDIGANFAAGLDTLTFEPGTQGSWTEITPNQVRFILWKDVTT